MTHRRRVVLPVLLPLLAALVAADTGCGPIETTIPSTKEVDVPGRGILGNSPLAPEAAFPADLVGQALAESITSSFDTSGYDKGAVKSLKLTTLTLTVTEPEEGGQQVRDLAFLQSLTLFLGAPDAEPIKVAESGDGDFDSGPIEYDVPLTLTELAEAFKSSSSLEMTADVVPGATPAFETTVRIDSVITVQIGL